MYSERQVNLIQEDKFQRQDNVTMNEKIQMNKEILLALEAAFPYVEALRKVNMPFDLVENAHVVAAQVATAIVRLRNLIEDENL